MTDLKTYVNDIWEELDGATRYAGLAMSHREDKTKAQTYKEMAAQEIQHAEKLWAMFGEQVEKCKKNYPEEEAFYSAIHKWEQEKVQAKIQHLRMALNTI